MQEIWKDIPNYEGFYQVSNLGNIKSLHYNQQNIEKILKQTKNSSGYYKVELYKNKKSKIFYVHRIVAMAFIPNPKNKSEVNHIDGNKLNNNVSNLEWNTISENQKHAIKHKLRSPSPMLGKFGKLNPNSKPVLQYDLNGNLVKRWDSIADIERELGINRSCISNNLIGNYKTSYGFVWKYAED
jgi:hypothetical protein